MRNSIDLIPSRQPTVTYITDALLGCNIPLLYDLSPIDLSPIDLSPIDLSPIDLSPGDQSYISTHESPPYRGIRGDPLQGN